jgi:3-hydroxyisobutyrate dehydrogenase-like beta-hydroxyacid dehydrogenase
VSSVRVGCIGLGNMGAGIAENIVRAGFAVRVFDIREQARRRLADAGAEQALTPAQAAEDAAVLAVTVLNDAQVDEVLFGADGAAAALPAGAVVVVHSTVSPYTCQRIAATLAERGVHLVDAPISGGQAAAENGRLTLMIGGEDAAVKAAEPVLEAVSAQRFHVGGVGAGQVAKLVNNLMGVVNRIVAAEGLELARAAGLREDAVLELLQVSSGNSWQIEHWRDMQQVARVSTTGPEGMAFMAKKDLGLALELGKELGLDLTITEKAKEKTEAMFSANG